MRKPPKSYLAVAFGPLIEGTRWLLEELAREQVWWHSVPFSWILALWGAFTLGLIVEDLANRGSWIRENLRTLQRIFELESVVPVHRISPQSEWLEITANIKFVRAIENVQMAVRVDANTNIPHAHERFVLQGESYARAVADERKHFVLAIVPLKRYDGKALGYQCWGSRVRESGDVDRMRSLSAGTRNTVEIQAFRRPWLRQSERFLLAATDAPGTGTSGRVFIDVDGEVRDPIAPTKGREPEPVQSPALFSRATQEQHWLETYKSLIKLSIEGFKFTALANGGAAVALLAYLGNLAGKNARMPDMRLPMGAFLAGLVSLGAAMVLAYLTQLYLLNETTNPRASPGRHSSLLWAAMSLVIVSLAAFAIGCSEAVRRF